MNDRVVIILTYNEKRISKTYSVSVFKLEPKFDVP